MKKMKWSLPLCLVLGTLLCFNASAQVQTQQSKGGDWSKDFEYVAKNMNPVNCTNDVYRTIDGTCNNISDPSKSQWGATHSPLLRIFPHAYGSSDPLNALGGENRKSPREISNIVCDQEGSIESTENLSNFAFSWGQFIDHDITLSPENENDPVPIVLPPNEPLFTVDIPFIRSEIVEGSGETGPREQFNILTAWIDGSMVYGSDDVRATWLRAFTNGKLKSSTGNFLPYNTIDGELGSALDPNAPSMFGDEDGDKMFVAGDIRANEQASLLSLHTLFMREHNRICDELIAQGMTDDELMYQTARKKVGAIIQSITYREFLPALKISLDAYAGYDDNVQPDIAAIFSTAAYRLGHTVVTDTFTMMGNDCEDMMEGGMPILETFFKPQEVAYYDVDPFLKGMAMKPQQEFDQKIIDALRNFLFINTPFSVMGIDLISLNLQRGRDHGIADFNTVRAYYTGQPATSMADISSDPTIQNDLAQAYNNDVNDIDPWIGFMCEDNMPNKIFGPTLHAVLKAQFERLRDGDRFYYETDPLYTSADIQEIHNTKLSKIIMRNTDIDGIDEDVFHVSPCRMFVECDSLTDKPLLRQGALYGETDFYTDGNEIYSWYDASTDQLVAEITGSPYYSPNALGTYYMVVSDPDQPDCQQYFGPRTITELDGCCELESDVVVETEKFALNGDFDTPEGIAIDARNGDIYTGSVATGSIQKTVNGVAQYFIPPGNSIFLPNVIGLTVDETNNRLWVCSNDLNSAFAGNPIGRITAIDLTTQAELVSFDHTDIVGAVAPFFNDVIVDAAGNAYLTNTLFPQIIKVEADLSAASILTNNFPAAPGGLGYSLNGIEDVGNYLIVVSFAGDQTTQATGLFRVDKTTGEVVTINWTETNTSLFAFGADGIIFVDDNTLLMASPAGTILRAELNSDYTSATITDIVAGTEAEECISGASIATLAIYGDSVYTTNAQVGSLLAGAPLDLPFQVIKVPLELIGF